MYKQAFRIRYLLVSLFLFAGIIERVEAQSASARGRARVEDRSRSLKEALTRRTSSAATGTGSADMDVGSISGGERFLRESRRPTAFVGRDLDEMSSFVGELQGSTSGNVRTSVSGNRLRMRRNANLVSQRTNQAVSGMYEPPLVVGFTVMPREPQNLESSLGILLNASTRIHHVGQLSVRVDGRTATLEGVVASDADRQLAEDYLRFEPSVTNVVNRLTLQPRPGNP